MVLFKKQVYEQVRHWRVHFSVQIMLWFEHCLFPRRKKFYFCETKVITIFIKKQYIYISVQQRYHFQNHQQFTFTVFMVHRNLNLLKINSAVMTSNQNYLSLFKNCFMIYYFLKYLVNRDIHLKSRNHSHINKYLLLYDKIIR